MSTEYLDLDDVLRIHRRPEVHGDECVRDMGIVASAVGRPQATAFGEDAYPTLWDKAAALLHSLAGNHGFTDGNKRTAWASAWAFLTLNGQELREPADQLAIVAFMRSVRNGTPVADIAKTLMGFAADT